MNGKPKFSGASLRALAGIALAITPAGTPSFAADRQDSKTDIDRQRAADIKALSTAKVSPLTPDQAMDKQSIGKRVRWAGAVHHFSRDAEGDCMTLLFAHSGPNGAPYWTQEPTYETFVACGAGSYDRDLVHEFSNVTIIGRVVGTQFIGMGGGGNPGPVIKIEALFRWSDCLSDATSPVCYAGFVTAKAATHNSE